MLEKFEAFFQEHRNTIIIALTAVGVLLTFLIWRANSAGSGGAVSVAAGPVSTGAGVSSNGLPSGMSPSDLTNLSDAVTALQTQVSNLATQVGSTVTGSGTGTSTGTGSLGGSTGTTPPTTSGTGTTTTTTIPTQTPVGSLPIVLPSLGNGANYGATGKGVQQPWGTTVSLPANQAPANPGGGITLLPGGGAAGGAPSALQSILQRVKGQQGAGT